MDFSLDFLKDAICRDFLSKKKVQEKNELTRNLSGCVLEKFNRY